MTLFILFTFFGSLLLLYLMRNFGWFLNFAQPQREITEFANEKKKFKPVPCGGILFMVIFAIYCYFFNKIDYQFWAIFAFFVVGLFDDIGKIAKKSHLSFMSGRFRLFVEILIASVFTYFFVESSNYVFQIQKIDFAVAIPFLVALPIVVFVVVGTLNAVNLTDGQDALAGKTVLVHLFFILVISGFEIITIGLIVCILAFLMFNTKPATVYMGDSGSMFLGAYLVIAYFNNKIEYILPLTGIVFVVETMSVILQVYSFKLTGKRIFKMSPFHHHLEKSGFAEEKTVALAFSVTTIACILAYNFVK